MNIHRRRVVAYIASNLINPKRAVKVIDVPAQSESLISGEVSTSLIAVFDHARQDYVLGHRLAPSLVRLTDLACPHGIDLTVDGQQFSGLDYETGEPFSGEIKEHRVMLFDAAEQTTFEYRV